MFDYFMLAYHLAHEAMIDGKLGEFFGHQVFRHRIIIPVEMNLLGSLPNPNLPNDVNIRFVEFQSEDLRAERWKFPVPSRAVKASRNIKRGLRGFALVHDTTVVGDLWCLCHKVNGANVSCPDFKMLDIVCREREAYAFDMYIDPTYRGKNLAVPLQRSLQHTLKSEGYKKVYGSYYEDNLPALWMHRMLKFKEYPRRKVFRFFFYLRSTLVDAANAPVPLTNTTQKGE